MNALKMDAGNAIAAGNHKKVGPRGPSSLKGKVKVVVVAVHGAVKELDPQRMRSWLSQ